MKTFKSTPNQILKLWEKNFEILNEEHRKEFKSHQITEKLTQFRIEDINAAIKVSNAKYLKEILEAVRSITGRTKRQTAGKVTVYKANQKEERLEELVYGRPSLVPNPFLSKYDRYICANRVTHGRSDECRCRVAA